jgi:serine protease AprX
VLTRLAQDPAKLDGRGHGSMVASMAAGEAPGYAGASPTSNLIDVDVMNDSGMALTSDVIRAADWILANKDAYGIRVANFSLHSTALASIRVHPLNRAVQKLWLAGVVVVAAATNTPMVDSCPGDAAKGLGTPRVPFSPANDPFVITVGALDINGTAQIGDDSMAPWSAHGYTCEGWAKPEIAAAGRFMVGAVPANASLASEQPSKVVAPGYMQLSGTSFSAAVMSGIVAQLLARHPDWTPDDVKGALMKTARRVVNASQLAQGRGQVNSVRGFTVQTVPNPHLALNQFVGPDTAEGANGNAFNVASWYDAMKLSAAWDSAAWAEAGWADAAWNEAAWFDAAWAEAAWAEAAWADAAWADSETYEDYALADPTSNDIFLEPVDEQDLATDPDLALP